MAWIYIVIAALFETAWTFSVKFFRFADLKLLQWDNVFIWNQSLPLIAPLAGYIIFGIGNVYFFSMAMKDLSAATTYGVWTACSLVFIKMAEVLFFGKTVSWTEIFFLTLIMTGIIGLRVFSSDRIV